MEAKKKVKKRNNNYGHAKKGIIIKVMLKKENN
jgi:hypothetical protein